MIIKLSPEWKLVSFDWVLRCGVKEGTFLWWPSYCFPDNPLITLQITEQQRVGKAHVMLPSSAASSVTNTQNPLGWTHLPGTCSCSQTWVLSVIAEPCPLFKRHQIGTSRKYFLFSCIETRSTDRKRFQWFFLKTDTKLFPWPPTKRNCFATGHHIPSCSQWEVHPQLLIAVPWFSEVTISTWALYGEALGAPILSLSW